jgi:hypothetical protein
VGTADAQYVLRSALQLRREHDLDSHVLFVDLIKAFDMANHELLFALLEKFGAPHTLVEPIRKLHRDFKLKFKIGRKEVLIDYLTGVKQSDNIAPALFLFLMQGMAKCLETKHIREAKKKPVQFQTSPDCNKRKNQMSIKPDWHQREGFLPYSHPLHQ